ncbi:hypothetical protein BGZ94_003460 [Podila epigama]|nr:hypothetical protein BGZ94_003460 [Podila epigama]
MLGLLGIGTGKVTPSPFLGLFHIATPERFSFQALYLQFAKARSGAFIVLTAAALIFWSVGFEIVWEEEDEDI